MEDPIIDFGIELRKPTVTKDKERQLLLERGYTEWEVELVLRLLTSPSAYVKFATKAQADTARLRMYNVVRFIVRNKESFPALSSVLSRAHLRVTKDGKFGIDCSARKSGPTPIGEIINGTV